MFAENFTLETLEKNIVLVFTLLLAFFIATFIVLEVLYEQKFEGVEDDEHDDEMEDEDDEDTEEEDEEEDEDEDEKTEDEEMEDEDEEDTEEEMEDTEDEEEEEMEEDELIPFACKARVNDPIVRRGTFNTTTRVFQFDNGLHAYSPSAACQVILKRRRVTNSWQGPSHVYLFINNKWVVFRETAYY
jgi:hypothetical protein